MKISYAIPVCNEHEELKRLLDFLEVNIRKEDEVVVQCDEGNTTPEVYKVINSERYSDGFREQFKVIEFPLNGHFANFKNNLKENCSGDWIFQIDADEWPDEYLISVLPAILEENLETEVFLIPRINEVIGIQQSHLGQWGWNMNDKGWINFPDYQTRILRNLPKIKWYNKVHEVIKGHQKFASLPSNEEYCLWHPKEITRQEIQNKYYSTI
jgi:glycosyltransferase involved in cell wall biosynthesis|tara:strand:+ start:143 stop:778 length:636 start_codon:yes stop_codon:yes gene_type:complete